jgi:hypothetical protein
MKILTFNDKGASSIEAVFVGVAMVFCLYLFSQVIFLLLSGGRLLVSADTAVRERFSKIKSPCLEKYAGERFKNGSYSLITPDIYVGFGAGSRKFKISRRIKFLDGEICN